MCEEKVEYNELCAEKYEMEQEAMLEVEREYSDVMVDPDEYIPTKEEVIDALLFEVRDELEFMSDAQKSYLKSVVDGAFAAATPKERLYNEIIDLQDKIAKLDEFMRKRNEDGVRLTTALGISEAGLYLMQKQLELEKELNDILVARYSIFDVKKN